MPIRVRDLGVAGKVYSNPFRGKADYTHQMAVDITALTAAEVDAYGYLKPGVPLQKTGALVSAPGQVIFGVVPEALNVLNLNVMNPDTFANALAAAGVQQIAVVTIGQVNKAIIEENLGRALTADELAAFAAAGCTIKLLA